MSAPSEIDSGQAVRGRSSGYAKPPGDAGSDVAIGPLCGPPFLDSPQYRQSASAAVTNPARGKFSGAGPAHGAREGDLFYPEHAEAKMTESVCLHRLIRDSNIPSCAKTRPDPRMCFQQRYLPVQFAATG